MAPPVTVAQFRVDFPEFAKPEGEQGQNAEFPDATITYWLNLSEKMLNADRFGADLIIVATELFTAHNVVLEALAQRDVDRAALPGLSRGVIAARSAGDVSVNWDTQSALEPGAGHWNLTVYGTRLKRLMDMVGAGPVQIGPSGSTGGGGWPGPPPWPGWLG